MMTPKVLPSAKLSLKDRLSRLTFLEASRLLGPEGAKLITRGGSQWDFERDDIRLSDLRFELRFADGTDVRVSIEPEAGARLGLKWKCSECFRACEHVGAAFSLILEEKMGLGLAAAPKARMPVESLDEEQLVARALAERTERARDEKMGVQSADPERPWTDYSVINHLSGKSYRVALRGLDAGVSFCSCPDFRTNTLGTCKHILHVLRKVKKRFSPQDLRRPYRRIHTAVVLRYADEVTLRLLPPARMDQETTRIVTPLLDRPITDMHDLLQRLQRLQKSEHNVVVYPDAEEFIQNRLTQERLAKRVAEIRRAPGRHPLRKSLLKVPLLPYQMDGIAFAAAAGRAILADDMGLGKTIQGVGVAELLAREAEIKRVLVVCPASLKSQWRSEIHRFCDRSVQLVSGGTAERASQYANDAFFTVCNYEQVLRDILAIERTHWDLIILDEGQRIKNWESKTSSVIKSLKSRYALVLSGTPLENRLDDLYSVVQFVDAHRLGPGFRFFNRHRIIDDKGKVLGYKNLGELREALAPVLLRRTRESVKLDLPPRTTEIVRIPPTDEQRELHGAHMRIVASIIRKKFISEMDLLRLQKALLMCRMTANSTYLVTKEEPGHSTKLEHLDELFEELFAEEERKVVLFSEWTTMLDLIEKPLNKRRLDFVRLDGSVPQRQRQELVQRFQTDPTCKLFVTTNAGSTGLNLQAANTVINVDLPWNPAVLEQRIARAHRMGQQQPVQVFVLVTENTIEENLLATIASKRDLALAALDPESKVNEVDVASGITELKGRLEVLLGAKPEAPRDETQKRASDEAALAQRKRLATAGGELLGAAFKFVGELAGSQNTPAPPLVDNIRATLAACVEQDAEGNPRLVLPIPDPRIVESFAETIAKLVGRRV